MRIVLLQVDKTQDPYISEGLQIFEKRIRNYAHFEPHTIHMPKAVRQKTPAEQKTAEAKAILQVTTDEDHLVLLDEKGRQFSSREFAGFIQKKQNASVKRLVFLIGGPYGFSDEIYKRSDEQLSLSKMTFSHQMVRLFFTEQLYRAFSILRGDKYHHD